MFLASHTFLNLPNCGTIYELRVALQRIQYRMLYFFYKKQCVITHGFIKKGGEVPQEEISLAVTRKAKFEDNPMSHTR